MRHHRGTADHHSHMPPVKQGAWLSRISPHRVAAIGSLEPRDPVGYTVRAAASVSVAAPETSLQAGFSIPGIEPGRPVG